MPDASTATAQAPGFVPPAQQAPAALPVAPSDPVLIGAVGWFTDKCKAILTANDTVKRAQALEAQAQATADKATADATELHSVLVKQGVSDAYLAQVAANVTGAGA